MLKSGVKRIKNKTDKVMNTTEKNILIAYFMGMIYDNHNDQPNKYWELTDEQNFVSQKPYPQHKDLKFHSSWDWLMQVVEKIRKVASYDKGDRFPTIVTITNSKVEIYSEKYGNLKKHDNTSFSKVFMGKGIEVVFNACVGFIEWFNNQNQ